MKKIIGMALALGGIVTAGALTIHNPTTNILWYSGAYYFEVGPNATVSITMTNNGPIVAEMGYLNSVGLGDVEHRANDTLFGPAVEGNTVHVVPGINIEQITTAGIQGLEHGSIIAAGLMIFLGVRKAFTIGDRYAD